MSDTKSAGLESEQGLDVEGLIERLNGLLLSPTLAVYPAAPSEAQVQRMIDYVGECQRAMVEAIDALMAQRDENATLKARDGLLAKAGARANAAERSLAVVRTALRELLDGIGIEFDDERLSYMTVQVDRIDWQAAERALLTESEPKTEPCRDCAVLRSRLEEASIQLTEARRRESKPSDFHDERDLLAPIDKALADGAPGPSEEVERGE